MKKLFKVIPILILFLLIIQVMPIKYSENFNDFFYLEKNIINKSELIQNGIRLEYKSKKNLKDEMKIIKDNLKKNNYKNIIEKDNNIFIKDKHKDIEIYLWEDEDITNVQISYINNDKNVTILELNQQVKKIQSITMKNIKYFNFIKVKIIRENKQDILDIIKKSMKTDTLEVLNIDNGTIAKGFLKDGSKINFANVTYDTGEYLILGTPVIFITY